MTLRYFCAVVAGVLALGVRAQSPIETVEVVGATPLGGAHNLLTVQFVEELLGRAFPWCKDHADGLKLLFRTYTDRKAEQRVRITDGRRVAVGTDHQQLFLGRRVLGVGHGPDLTHPR